MDVIARIRENVQKLRETRLENNVSFAEGLEKCILNFIDTDSKSLAEACTKERNFNEVKDKALISNEAEVITKITPQASIKKFQVIRNIDIFNSRSDGFDQWAEYEDNEDGQDLVDNTENSAKDFVLQNFKQGHKSLEGLGIKMNEEHTPGTKVVRKNVLEDSSENESKDKLTNSHTSGNISVLESRMNRLEEGILKESFYKVTDKTLIHDIIEETMVIDKLVEERRFEGDLQRQNNIEASLFGENKAEDDMGEVMARKKYEDDTVRQTQYEDKDKALPANLLIFSDRFEGLEKENELEENGKNINIKHMTEVDEKGSRTINFKHLVYFPETEISQKEQTKSTSNPNPEMKCNLCNFVAKNGKGKREGKREITKHLGMSHFVCSVCESTLGNKKELKRHITNNHVQGNTDGYMVCNRDGCSFTAKAWRSNKFGIVCFGSAMTAHIRSVHHGVWSCCDQCKYKSANKSGLVRHTHMKHPTLPRPKVKCILCETQLLKTKEKYLYAYEQYAH